MLQKLHLISEKLSGNRPDVWLCEMLYKFISGDMDPLEAEGYQFNQYSDPKRTLNTMISELLSEANS